MSVDSVEVDVVEKVDVVVVVLLTAEYTPSTLNK